MAELTVTTFVSLDGVMQAPGGSEEDTSGDFTHGGWVFPLADAVMGNWVVENISRAEAFLLGRTTYDIFAGYWPRFPDPNDPIAFQLNHRPKHVASRTRSTFAWNNSRHLPEVVSGVAELKRRCVGEIQVHGSAGLLQTLIAHDLVDEYRILTFPVLLGRGKRLFGGGTVPRSLQLVRTVTSSTGVLLGVYRPAGALQTGTFAID
ncbi:dihydrofolate reductase family protein [Desulfuromonas carbonis]|uniref:dihydrofolate reductase family protein n=1 Tax=Desulfuromonas sp. DDH964 TaxID=1823759 RepID=UPI00078DE123|nr:dihydrofolate reductase family protein [Desulfuromonas sp. DDH964]AMV73635.1 dihydrofolate reductase [Desulfuromonas sp. DDH964]